MAEREKYMEFLEQNSNLIYKVCSCYCPDPEERKDLQQEILIQLWNSFPRFDGRVKPSTWTYRVALNTAISFYRRSKKHTGRKVRLNESIISLPERGKTYDDETIELLYKYINHLNEFDKALLILYMDGNKYSEISNILGISETNVATKIGRIKGYLRTQFKNF